MGDIYSVSEVNAYIKSTLTNDRNLRRIYVKGEVSNCKYHTSGHIYFTLKDKLGQIACVMFSGQRAGLSFRLEEGMSIIVLGNIDVYERNGSYQLYAAEIRLDGVGKLYEQYELLKKRLEAEGLFEQAHKKAIPAYVKKVGVVTAATGAAIQDILQISGRRNPYVQIVLYPAKVQGEGAAQTIVAGIKALEKTDVDVIIVGRGGGSIEDLWAFNEEAVAYAIYECNTPIVSAVGHETDFTIADFVSDLRAPTPSAAAELTVFDYAVLEEKLAEIHGNLVYMMQSNIERQRNLVEKYSARLAVFSPRNMLESKKQQIANGKKELSALIHRRIEIKRHELAIALEKFEALSPVNKLNSGYSYVTDAAGKNIKSVEQVQKADTIYVTVTDGTICARVENTKRQSG